MLSWEYPPHIVGGLGRHVYELSKSLSAKGIEVKVLTYTDGSSPAREEVDGVSVVRANPYGTRYPDFVSWVHGLNMQMIEAAKYVGNFDLLHAHDWLAACAGISLKHITRKPLLATIHSTEMGRRGSLKNDYERHIHELEWWLSYEAWKVICCSNYMLGEVSKNLSCPAEKMTVIPNGYAQNGGDLDQPIPQSRRDYALNSERIVLFVGRLVFEKGPHLLLEAASKLPDQNLKYVIVGDGSMKPYLMELSKKLGISQKVYFLGHVSDAALANFYKWASVAVFPSLYEPFGIVALEAMGSGAPVIVSGVGGLNEIIQDGFNGLKFAPGSADSLAYQIRRLANDEALRSYIIKNAQASLVKYSWDYAASGTIGVYERVLKEYSRSAWNMDR
jgi:glycosyltransferase involved in cell wall biosynthesis